MVWYRKDISQLRPCIRTVNNLEMNLIIFCIKPLISKVSNFCCSKLSFAWQKLAKKYVHNEYAKCEDNISEFNPRLPYCIFKI